MGTAGARQVRAQVATPAREQTWPRGVRVRAGRARLGCSDVSTGFNTAPALRRDTYRLPGWAQPGSALLASLAVCFTVGNCAKHKTDHLNHFNCTAQRH